MDAEQILADELAKQVDIEFIIEFMSIKYHILTRDELYDRLNNDEKYFNECKAEYIEATNAAILKILIEIGEESGERLI